MDKNAKERMIEGVNKIIAQKLLSSESVYLPSVGSIAVRLKPAEMQQSSSKVSAPVKTLQFTSTAEGESLVELIQANAGCTVEQAQELYQKYISNVRTLRGIEIAGVGTLVDRSFMIYREFAALLNPVNEVEAPMRRSSNIGGTILNLGALAVILSAILFGMQNGYFDNINLNFDLSRFTSAKQQNNDYYADQYYADDEVYVIESDQTQSEVVESYQVIEATPEPQYVEPETTTLPIQSTTSASSSNSSSYAAKYCVVYGVFSQQANVTRASREAMTKLGNVDITTMPYKGNTAVVVFRSNSREAAQRFLNRNYGKSNTLWIYEAK